MSPDEIHSYTLWDVIVDVYFGKGKNDPSITMRLRDLEQFKEDTKAWQADLRSWFKALILFSLGQTCAIIGGLIYYAVNKK